MSIFIQIETDAIVQVGDKVRINASRSFLSPDEAAITLFEIQPNAAAAFYDVTANQYLDWVYTAAAVQTVTVRITTDGSPTSGTATLTSITSATDNLFSTDADLKAHEDDVLSFLAAGRSSYKYLHRRAQTLILAHLDKEGRVDLNRQKYTKASFVDVEEGKEWSTFLVLRLLFAGISNAVDDEYARKSKDYEGKEAFYRDRVVLRLDVDGDGDVDEGEEEPGLRSCIVVRR